MKTNIAKLTPKIGWYVVDATNKTLGRLASALAQRLRGKHKAEYTPHLDHGDYIVLINAQKVRVTGNKAQDKVYYSHSGYPGGLKTTNYTTLLTRFPERVIYHAVAGMLPKNPLGRKMIKKLKVYKDAMHPHQSQQPELIEVLA